MQQPTAEWRAETWRGNVAAVAGVRGRCRCGWTAAGVDAPPSLIRLHTAAAWLRGSGRACATSGNSAKQCACVATDATGIECESRAAARANRGRESGALSRCGGVQCSERRARAEHCNVGTVMGAIAGVNSLGQSRSARPGRHVAKRARWVQQCCSAAGGMGSDVAALVGTFQK